MTSSRSSLLVLKLLIDERLTIRLARRKRKLYKKNDIWKTRYTAMFFEPNQWPSRETDPTVSTPYRIVQSRRKSLFPFHIFKEIVKNNNKKKKKGFLFHFIFISIFLPLFFCVRVWRGEMNRRNPKKLGVGFFSFFSIERARAQTLSTTKTTINYTTIVAIHTKRRRKIFYFRIWPRVRTIIRRKRAHTFRKKGSKGRRENIKKSIQLETTSRQPSLYKKRWTPTELGLKMGQTKWTSNCCIPLLVGYIIFLRLYSNRIQVYRFLFFKKRRRLFVHQPHLLYVSTYSCAVIRKEVFLKRGETRFFSSNFLYHTMKRLEHDGEASKASSQLPFQ